MGHRLTLNTRVNDQYHRIASTSIRAGMRLVYQLNDTVSRRKLLRITRGRRHGDRTL